MADEHIVIIDDDDLNDGAAAESASSSKPEQVSNEPGEFAEIYTMHTCRQIIQGFNVLFVLLFHCA